MCRKCKLVGKWISVIKVKKNELPCLAEELLTAIAGCWGDLIFFKGVVPDKLIIFQWVVHTHASISSTNQERDRDRETERDTDRETETQRERQKHRDCLRHHCNRNSLKRTHTVS